MSRYAIIENGVVANIVVADSSYGNLLSGHYEKVSDVSGTTVCVGDKNANGKFVGKPNDVSSLSITAPSPLSLSVRVNGSWTTYQWKKDGTNITGETSQTLTIDPTTASTDDGDYTCEVSDGTNTLTTDACAVTVT